MPPTRRGCATAAGGFVILGIINALTEKFLYEQEAAGLAEYGTHKFVKPFFFATMLFFGVAMSLPVYIILSWMGREGYPPISSLTKGLIFKFVLPGFFGCFQGVMSSITIATIGVSVDYMMRSATLIGVTLVARFYFKRSFTRYELTGVITVAISLILVGLASVLNAENSSTVMVSKKWAVVILIFKAISQFVYSIKLSIEQFVTQQRRMHPMLVSGFESTWEFTFGALIVLPLAHIMPGREGNGIHENAFDTFAQLKSSPYLILIMLFSLCVEGIYSVSSVELTSATSAVMRTLVECFRNFLIWVVQLCLFYGLAGSESLSKFRGVGEEWSKGSWIQLFGYGVLLVGLMTYGGVFSKQKGKEGGLSLLDDQYPE